MEEKVEGKEVTSIAPQVQKTQVIDLMEALKQSLETRTSKDGTGATKKPAAKAVKSKAAAKESKRASR